MRETPRTRFKFRQFCDEQDNHQYGMHYVDPYKQTLVRDGGWHTMQATGLTDKNGKEIYEGDIVHSEQLNARAEVRYGNAHFFIVGGTAAQPLVAAGWELSPDAHGVEVIGNIYENPELLTV